MGILYVIALLLGLVNALAQAEPRVIYDAGRGVPTDRSPGKAPAIIEHEKRDTDHKAW